MTLLETIITLSLFFILCVGGMALDTSLMYHSFLNLEVSYAEMNLDQAQAFSLSQEQATTTLVSFTNQGYIEHASSSLTFSLGQFTQELFLDKYGPTQ